MLLGLISDIHSNLQALDAVLAQLAMADKILCAGDVVGYYDQPNEVCARLREIDAETIRGNHDAYVIGALEPAASRRAAYRTDWTRTQLTSENLDWLRSLPVERRFTFDSRDIVLRHANPWDEETYLYPDSPRLGDVGLPRESYMVVGHTHYPLRYMAGEGILINPGSVGQPRDRDPRASHALLNTSNGAVSFFRSDYDVAKMQKRLESLDWDRDMISILSRTGNDIPLQNDRK
jgi:putative phosphoesterase